MQRTALSRLFMSLSVAFFLPLLVTAALKAQDSQSYGALTLHGSIPSSEPYSNVAKFGGGLGFDGANFIHPLFGIAYHVGVNINPYNRSSTNFGLNVGANDDTQPWVNANLMLGGELSYPVTPAIAPEFRALAGLMVARAPQIKYGTLGEIEADIAPAFGYSIGGGLKFINNEGASAVRIGIQYQAANPKFSRKTSVANIDTGAVEGKQKIDMLSVYVSFAFLSRK
jgi:hypothetical protein